MKKVTISRIFAVAFIFFSLSAVGISQESVVKSILNRYSEVYEDPLGYLDGRRNTFLYPAASGTPWFIMTGQVNSVLETTKGTYHDLLLNYDILNDQLILSFSDTSGVESIMINKNIILGFSLFGARFINADTVLLPEAGFYEEVYNNDLKFYVKHEKILVRQSGPVQNEYRYRILKYLVKNNKYAVVNNNRSLIKALGDKKSSIKSFLKENQILIRLASNDEIISILEFYEGL